MKKIVIFIAAFVVATGATTGANMALRKKPPVTAASDSAAADSTKADSVKTDTAAVAAPSDSAAAAVAAAAATPDTTKPATPPAAVPPLAKPSIAQSTQEPVQQPTTKTEKPKSASAQQDAPAATPPTPVTDSLGLTGEKRIGKVFSSMTARDAAKVLEKMSDADVHTILGYLPPKQAASVLALMAPDRVAALSKGAMHGGSGGTK